MLYGEVKEIPFEVLNPPKSATLRLPTPEEMLERLRVQRTIQRDLGRRRTSREFVRNPAADLKLFNVIRVDRNGNGSAEFDEYEAEHCIGVLTGAEVTGSERDGMHYRVFLHWKQFGPLEGDTEHVLRIPTMKQLKLYQRGVIAMHDLPFGQTELRYNCGAAVELYDELLVSASGYAEGVPVPPHHKTAVVTELTSAVQNADAGKDPAGF